VRHDRHAVAAATAIGIAALSGSIVLRIKPAALITMLVFAALACGYIDNHYVAFSPARMVMNVLDEYRNLARGLEARATGRNVLDAEFNSFLASLKQQVPLPPMQGTIDIYSYGQIIVFANGLRWRPRPIFQSYQSYTAELAKRNADHLQAAYAPDNIAF